MSANSKIDCTEHSWNTVSGCTKISQECKSCYAETMTKRLQAMGIPKYLHGFSHVTVFLDDKPLHVKKPGLFFVNSMGDTFHEEVTNHELDHLFTVMEHADQHIFQVLTKRARRMAEYLNARYSGKPFPQNIWVGTTVGTKARISEIKHLKSIGNASVRFISCEPLLEDLGELDLSGIDWVIVGGESGHRARPMKKEWVLNVISQARDYGAKVFFKQWGMFDENGDKVRSKKLSGYLVDGVAYREMPEMLGGL